MWDKRVVGQSVTFKRNPFYWQKGKPYLDSVTWTYVTDENTRELQLRGGQIQVDEFPPFNSIAKLQKTPGVMMTLFPSTRTDYLVMNQSYPAARGRATCGARSRTRSTVRRSSSRCSSASARPANSFMPPQVPYYDPKSPGIKYDMAKAKAELAKSKFKNGFKVDPPRGRRRAGRQRDRADPPAVAEAAQHRRQVRHEGHVAPRSTTSASATTSSVSATGRWTSPIRTSS